MPNTTQDIIDAQERHDERARREQAARDIAEWVTFPDGTTATAVPANPAVSAPFTVAEWMEIGHRLDRIKRLHDICELARQVSER